MLITPIYAALLALLFIYLSIRVIKGREAHEVALGDGGHSALQRRVRVHANFAEYVPLALILIAMLEWLGGWGYLIHGLGIALLAGRLMHAFGVSQTKENLRYRVIGMVLTFITLLVGAIGILVLSVL